MILIPVFQDVTMPFYSAEAILLTNDLKASSHKGVISLFGEHFIKTGKLDKELGKALRRAYELR